jgi:hypothetical protein
MGLGGGRSATSKKGAVDLIGKLMRELETKIDSAEPGNGQAP